MPVNMNDCMPKQITEKVMLKSPLLRLSFPKVTKNEYGYYTILLILKLTHFREFIQLTN